MSKVILTDTGFWLSLLDPLDQFHNDSEAIAELIQNYTLILPWPCLYETLNTRLIRKRERLLHFEQLTSKSNIILMDDLSYRNDALLNVYNFSRSQGVTYSLVDNVIREILKDVNVKINYLVTFNSSDFKDICDKRNVGIFGN